MGSLRTKLNYGCMSEGELEVRRKWQELKCASYPWRQSDSPHVPLHLRGPWREDPQVVMVTKSNSMTQKSSSCSKKKNHFCKSERDTDIPGLLFNTTAASPTWKHIKLSAVLFCCERNICVITIKVLCETARKKGHGVEWCENSMKMQFFIIKL